MRNRYNKDLRQGFFGSKRNEVNSIGHRQKVDLTKYIE